MMIQIKIIILDYGKKNRIIKQEIYTIKRILNDLRQEQQITNHYIEDTIKINKPEITYANTQFTSNILKCDKDIEIYNN